MPINEVPLFRYSECWTQRTALDGADYNLQFGFNRIVKRFWVSIRDQDGVPVRLGMKLVPGRNLLEGSDSVIAPPGMLVVVDSEGLINEAVSICAPTWGTLGSRHKLYYLDLENVVDGT